MLTINGWLRILLLIRRRLLIQLPLNKQQLLHHPLLNRLHQRHQHLMILLSQPIRQLHLHQILQLSQATLQLLPLPKLPPALHRLIQLNRPQTLLQPLQSSTQLLEQSPQSFNLKIKMELSMIA